MQVFQSFIYIFISVFIRSSFIISTLFISFKINKLHLYQSENSVNRQLISAKTLKWHKIISLKQVKKNLV